MNLICEYCEQPIADMHVISGSKVEHWATLDQDFGCDKSPINDIDGVGNHEPKI